MKKREVIQLFRDLNNNLLKPLRGAKLLYAIDRNYSKLESEVKSLEKAGQPDKDYLEYDKERDQINIRYSEKIDGQPKIRPLSESVSEYIIAKDMKEEHGEEMCALEKKYKSIIEKRKKEVEDFNKLLEEDSDFVPYYINRDILPEDIEWGAYQLIRAFIKKEDE